MYIKKIWAPWGPGALDHVPRAPGALAHTKQNSSIYIVRQN